MMVVSFIKYIIKKKTKEIIIPLLGLSYGYPS